MTTDQQTTPLDRAQVETQIRAWFTAGLPEGTISLSRKRPWAYLEVADANAVLAWAGALGQQVRMVDGVTATQECYPASLAGWSLEVYCARTPGPGVQIEMAEAVTE